MPDDRPVTFADGRVIHSDSEILDDLLPLVPAILEALHSVKIGQVCHVGRA